MTFKRFEQIFLSKYPDGTVWAHDVFEHGVPGRRQKVAVEFERGGRVYMYRGAYEDILSRLGFKVISKQRLDELKARLKQYEDWDGTDNFFGGVCDYKKEIAEIKEQIKAYEEEYIIA